MMSETSRAIFYRCGRIAGMSKSASARTTMVVCVLCHAAKDTGCNPVGHPLRTLYKNGGDRPVLQQKIKEKHWRRNNTHTQNSNILDTRARISVIPKTKCCVFYGIIINCVPSLNSEEPFFQLCCCVSFLFWREIGFGFTYYLCT